MVNAKPRNTMVHGKLFIDIGLASMVTAYCEAHQAADCWQRTSQDSTHYDKTLELLRKYDPDFAAAEAKQRARLRLSPPPAPRPSGPQVRPAPPLDAPLKFLCGAGSAADSRGSLIEQGQCAGQPRHPASAGRPGGQRPAGGGLADDPGSGLPSHQPHRRQPRPDQRTQVPLPASQPAPAACCLTLRPPPPPPPHTAGSEKLQWPVG